MPEYIYYKIVCKDENIKDCYVGKTNNLKKRFLKHKSNCYNENHKFYNLNLYKFIRENGGINNWNFIEIETNKYDKKDSAIRERYLIEELNANLNIVIPSRTLQEWKEDNKKYHKKYYIKNKEIIKEYRENNKEKRKEYLDKNIEKIKEKEKEYYEKNKDKILEKKKEYRENNKEKIKEKKKEYYEKNKDKILEKKKNIMKIIKIKNN